MRNKSKEFLTSIVVMSLLIFSLGTIFMRNTEMVFTPKVASNLITTSGKNIETRFNCPIGFERGKALSGSFGEYLRKLPLKPSGSKVQYFDGTSKPSEGVYCAVVDLPIGKKDIHHCADAVMHLRAEYLYQKGDYSSIHFNFTNGFRCDYSKWMEGYRVAIKGNSTTWVKTAKTGNTRELFWQYLEMVFNYAGTASLSKELKSIPISDMQIGDVFIRGGSPGHAVIVIDMATNPKTGEKLFMLAQSYMPAQEIQVLINPENSSLSPWYSSKFDFQLITPQYIFNKDELKRF